MSKGCVLDLKMRDKQGAVVTDYSRYGNDGAVNGGVVWTDKGMRFDGSTGYLNCGNDSSLDITDAITISCWVNPSAIATGFIISKYQDANHRYDTVMTSTYLSSSFGDGTTSKSAKYTMTPVAGIWYNLVTNINSSGVIKIYVDCVEGELSETLPNPVASITGDLIIGERSAAFFNGIIDNPQIYNYALSLREIKAMYNSTRHNYV